MMKLRQPLAAFVLCGLLGSLLASGADTVITNLGAPSKMRFALPSDCTNDEVHLCFSKSGGSVCAWWWPHRKAGDYEKDPVEFAVIDLAGHLLGTSDNTNRSQLLHEFPVIGWREHWKDFVKDSFGWSFSCDFSTGLRIQSTGEASGPFVAEMWDLAGPQKLLWKTPIPGLAGRPRPVELLTEPSDNTILIADGGQQLLALDGKTGQIQQKFTPGPIETRAEAVKRKKRFHLDAADDGDPSLYFSAFTMAYEPKASLLACGAFFDKRVRVIKTSSPSRIVFETNADVNPALPKGGRWTVQRVEFLARGKYMLAEYHFGGRGTAITLGPTEVFDTSTWKLLWQQDNSAVRAVTLSPDGTMLALLRANVVEIYPFSPGGTGSQK